MSEIILGFDPFYSLPGKTSFFYKELVFSSQTTGSLVDSSLLSRLCYYKGMENPLPYVYSTGLTTKETLEYLSKLEEGEDLLLSFLLQGTPVSLEYQEGSLLSEVDFDAPSYLEEEEGRVLVKGVLSEGVFYAYSLDLEDFSFSDLEEPLQLLEEWGFSVPPYYLLEASEVTDLPLFLEQLHTIFDEDLLDLDYTVEGYLLFSQSLEKPIFLEDLSLTDNLFQGRVHSLEWVPRGSYFVPEVLISVEGVKIPPTLSSVLEDISEPLRVPLFSPRVVNLLETFPDNSIFMRYSPTLGFLPCSSDGSFLELDVLSYYSEA